MSASIPTATHLRYAAGYLALRLYAEAEVELASILAEDQDSVEVLALRTELRVQTKDWAAGAALAESLCQRDPTDAGHWIQWAYAVRRAKDIPTAREILLNAVARHPEEPILHFNLACYEAQLGNFTAARAHLLHACVLLPECKAMGLADADLAPLHPWIAAGMPQT